MKKKILEDQWVVGFVDALGQFIVDVIDGKIELIFRIEVPKEDVQTLYKLKKIFQCGKVEETDNGWMLTIRKPHCIKNVVEYFEKHWLKTRRRVDFIKFRKIFLKIMKERLTEEDIEDIAKYAGGIRTTSADIVEKIAGLKKGLDEDTVHPQTERLG